MIAELAYADIAAMPRARTRHMPRWLLLSAMLFDIARRFAAACAAATAMPFDAAMPFVQRVASACVIESVLLMSMRRPPCRRAFFFQ